MCSQLTIVSLGPCADRALRIVLTEGSWANRLSPAEEKDYLTVRFIYYVSLTNEQQQEFSKFSDH